MDYYLLCLAFFPLISSCLSTFISEITKFIVIKCVMTIYNKATVVSDCTG